jgi:hypothetical protein
MIKVDRKARIEEERNEEWKRISRSRAQQEESRELPYHGHFEINDDGVEDGDPQHEADQLVLFHALIRVPVVM